jgi:hypothetical protein
MGPVRFIVIVCLVGAWLAARPAAAAVTIVYRDQSGARSTWYADRDRVRIQNPGFDDADIAVLTDLAAKRTVFLGDGAQAYFDEARFLKAAHKRLAPALQAGRELARRLPPIGYVPSHERRTIGAFTCDMYTGFRDGRVVEEVCAAPWGSPAVGAQKDYAFLDAALAGFMSQIFGGRGVPRGAPAGAALPGLAVWRQDINEDRSRGDVSEIESVSREPIPAAIFSVPPSYHEVTSFQGLESPKAAPARAPEAPPAAAVAEASAPPSPWRRVTGIVLVLLIGFGTFMLFVHAGLMHFAAKLVLHEPRFIDALVAVLLLWVVSVPLTVLGAWLPVALPVELLAGYAGIHLSYRTSPGRTIALLAASALVALFVALALAMVAGAFGNQL